MSLKTLATLFVQKLAPQNALSAENTIISLLFKNWLVCVCVYSPNGFKCLVHFLFSPFSFDFMLLFYHIQTLFQVLYSKTKVAYKVKFINQQI